MPVSGDERIAYLRRVVDLMDLRFADPIDLDQMAAQAGFSKFHFARAFKDAYGETPANYLTCRRVERAKDLLRSANLTVTEVCMLVGFSSLGSFSSRSRRWSGCHPAPSSVHRWPAAGRRRFPGVSSWTGRGPAEADRDARPTPLTRMPEKRNPGEARGGGCPRTLAA